MLDRILLICLIIFLPIGIVASKQWLTKSGLNQSSKDTDKQLETIVQKLNEKVNNVPQVNLPEPKASLNITGSLMLPKLEL
jgi:hypothetical protein